MADFQINTLNDSVTGTSGNDNFYLPDLGLGGPTTSGVSLFQGSIDGAGGTDTLHVLQSSTPITSLPDGPTTIHLLYGSITSVEKIQFASTAGHNLGVIVPYTQFDTTIGSNTQLIGGAGRDQLLLQAFATGTYTMPSLNLSGWSSGGGAYNRGDTVGLFAYDVSDHTLIARDNLNVTQILRGWTAHDTLIGSNGTDQMIVTAGGDDVMAKGGNDYIVLQAMGNPADGTQTGGDFSGGTLDGGAGIDTLVIGGHISYSGTITGIEQIMLLPSQPYVSDPILGVVAGQLAPTFTVDTASLGGAPTLRIQGQGSVTINVSETTPGAGGQFDGSGIGVSSVSLTSITINGTAGADAITGTAGADSIVGGDGVDLLHGGKSNDILHGDAGNDTLFGDAGTDQLFGGDNNDVLVGGAGNDNLYGGAGADTFTYLTAADSTVKTSGRDTIWDFSHAQGDKIDLHGLAVSSGTTLSLAGSFFGHQAGQVIQTVVGGNVLLSADLNGDAIADFAILIKGQTAPLVLGDFVL